MALKLNCTMLPSPNAWKETYVHGLNVHGVHLRGGPVARGGIRHSDRPTDYRTEVLGLMLAQMRKNSIVVPVGAKGGFVVVDGKTPTKIEAAYRCYIRALLSLTDTYQNGKVVNPINVLCHDEPDPYLVVAADKGTASLSNVANEESLGASYWGRNIKGFWLADAFASGSKTGYDHKHMGITAKGAWVSVEHHLKTLGITPSAKNPIRITGIGDMGGDVFGNGLLRSPHVQLVAAFNHKHIFIDPTPNPAASFTERKRCFEKNLGWDGYNSKLISKGGGVFSRTDKTITLSNAAQIALGVNNKTFTPEELIKAILSAPVDVLWNGGIGTYIKAGTESHIHVADKANDEERIDATHVRAKIIAEGGNLGITPAGRIELALRGVKLNTDALDNSAGVNTSDQEVNLKIALQPLVAAGSLSHTARNTLLAKVAPQVEAAVLTNNRLQNNAVSLEEQAPASHHATLAVWQNTLLERGVLSISTDHLPTASQLAARPNAAYTRPELATLLAGTKATLKTQLQQPDAADILASSVVQNLLLHYYPPAVIHKMGKGLTGGALAPALAATQTANLLVNRLGIGFGATMAADFNVCPLDIVRAALIAIDVLDLQNVWQKLEAANVSQSTYLYAMQRTRIAAATLTAWVLRHGGALDINIWCTEFNKPLHALTTNIHKLLSKPAVAEFNTRVKTWQKQGLPLALSQQLASLSPLAVAPDAVRIAARLHKPVPDVMRLHLAVGDMLSIPSLVRISRAMAAPDSWTRMAVQANVQELGIRQRGLTSSLLRAGGKNTLLNWQKSHAAGLKRYHTILEQLLAEPTPSIAMLNVICARLRELEL
jgi:glutamate dehydrogenase